MYDQAQSPRLGQPAPVESTGIRIFTGLTLPEVSYPGQVIFRSDTKVMQVYDQSVGAWADVLGGVRGQLTFVGPPTPTALNPGDLWYDVTRGHMLLEWDGTVWVEKPFGPDAIAPDAINATHLDAENITGLVLTGNTIRTADSGPRVELGPQGLLLVDDSENVHQAATMGGDLHANSLVVDNDMTMSGSGVLYGEIDLAAGVRAPTTAPILTQGWRYVVPSGSLSPTASDWISLCDDNGTNWVTVMKGYAYVTGVIAFTQPRIIFIDKTSGAQTAPTMNWAISGTSGSAAFREGRGITRIGSNFYLLCREGSSGVSWFLHKFDLTGTELAAYNLSSTLNTSSAVQEWTLGTDGTYLVTVAAFSSHGGDQVVRTLKWTTSGSSVSTFDITIPSLGDVTGYWAGAADFASFSPAGAGVRHVMTGSGGSGSRVAWFDGTRLMSDEWRMPSVMRGVWWDGTRFWTLDPTGTVVRYSTVTANETDTYSYAWTDGSSQHTEAGPDATITRHARQYVHVKTVMPPRTPAALQVALFGGTTSRTLQNTYAPGLTESDEGSVTPSGTAEYTTNTFTGAGVTAGSLAATTGGFTIDGYSDGSVGTGTFRDSVDARVAAAVQGGTKNSGTISASTPKDVTVTFTRAFATTPVVVATSSITGDPSTCAVAVHNITTTGFVLRFVRTIATAFDATWIATSA